MAEFIPQLEEALKTPQSGIRRFLASQGKDDTYADVLEGIRKLQRLLASHPDAIDFNGKRIPDIELMLSALDALQDADQVSTVERVQPIA